MKASLECAPCLIQRGYTVVLRATGDPRIQSAVFNRLLDIMARQFELGAVPAYIWTEWYRIVKERTGNLDPYNDEKHRSNVHALELLPRVRGMIYGASSGYERFRKICLASIASNIIDFDVPRHSFDYSMLEEAIISAELAIDDTERVYNLLKGGVKKTLFLTDNAGEIVFDTLLVKEICDLGSEVIVAVKEAPMLNDATMDDARRVGMDRVASRVITIGTDSVGLILRDTSEEFRRILYDAEFIVSKGMGNYETLSEEGIEKPIAYFFACKCSPVGRSVGVDKGANVALLRV